MKERKHHERQILPVPAEKWLLATFALFSLVCHVVVLISWHHFQGKMVLDHLSSVITVDLQVASPPVGKAGLGTELAPPAPRPALSRQVPIATAPAAVQPQRKSKPVGQSEQQTSTSVAAVVEQGEPGSAVSVVDAISPQSDVVLPSAAAGSFEWVEGGSVGIGQKTTGAGSSGDAARARYLEQVKKLIEERLDYPLMARKMGMQGSVQIRCRLSRDGTRVAAEVAAASPYALLDQAALRAVDRVGRFPAVPPEVAGEEVVLTIPLRFRLGKERAD